ncbi:hypothetical protein OK074_0202 [Actinobacteria bacterium OK074]|nr:hypothetical protein OK074_0202 [Actinobacteria bacterium OK074]
MTENRIEFGVPSEMRDGTVLRADDFRPGPLDQPAVKRARTSRSPRPNRSPRTSR